MKKTLLLTMASATFALAPIAGVFADSCDTPKTDTININVSENCSLERTNGTGSYTVSMNPGATNNSFGSSTFSVICNNATGFYVRAAFTAFTDQRTSGTKGTNISYAASAPATTASAATWTAVLGESSSTSYIKPSTDSSPTDILSANAVTASSGVTQKVTYKVATATNQAKGTYQATATYTLTQNS